jgi:hypothetical protein
MKNIFIAFLLGLALGITLTTLYPLVAPNTSSPSAGKALAKDLVKQVNQSEKSYAQSVDSFKVKSSKLQAELTDTKAELNKAKQKSRSLQTAIYDLLDKQVEEDAGESTLHDNSCDSLIGTVEDLMQASSEKDSLYEQVALNLEEQLTGKDSVILLKDQQYQEIRSAFNQSIESQNGLAQENKQLNRQVKRQKFKSKVLSAALLILGGAATNYLLRR